jgi:hypothetical protein
MRNSPQKKAKRPAQNPRHTAKLSDRLSQWSNRDHLALTRPAAEASARTGSYDTDIYVQTNIRFMQLFRAWCVRLGVNRCRFS